MTDRERRACLTSLFDSWQHDSGSRTYMVKSAKRSPGKEDKVFDTTIRRVMI